MKETKIPTPIESDSLEVIPNIQRVTEFIQFVQWFATPCHLRKKKPTC